ncbi:MAG: hypothetical protein HUJ63_03670 [Enterococcus sp.]|nr:hypothetical protein [Enterococcus sp.]
MSWSFFVTFCTVQLVSTVSSAKPYLFLYTGVKVIEFVFLSFGATLVICADGTTSIVSGSSKLSARIKLIVAVPSCCPSKGVVADCPLTTI